MHKDRNKNAIMHKDRNKNAIDNIIYIIHKYPNEITKLTQFK